MRAGLQSIAIQELPVRHGQHHKICTKLHRTQECSIPVFPGVSMPGKSKTHKTNDSTDDLWVAPRPSVQKQPRTYEPVAGSRLNRYLEFADIALGVKDPGTSKKRPAKAGVDADREKPGPKTVSINHGSARRGFGAFRNSR